MSVFQQPVAERSELDPASKTATPTAVQTAAPTAAPTAVQTAVQTAAQLRAEFDRTFTLPVLQPTGLARDFVILEVAAQRYALEAQGLHTIERIGSRDLDREHPASPRFAQQSMLSGDSSTRLEPGRSSAGGAGRGSAMAWIPVPSTQPALLGIRTFGGRIVPVFALATLLGLRASKEASHCALVRVGPDLVGFAFDALLRFARIEPEQLFAPGAAAQPWEEATLADSGEVFAVLALPALLRLLAPSSNPSQARSNPPQARSNPPQARENPPSQNGQS